MEEIRYSCMSNFNEKSLNWSILEKSFDIFTKVSSPKPVKDYKLYREKWIKFSRERNKQPGKSDRWIPDCNTESTGNIIFHRNG